MICFHNTFNTPTAKINQMDTTMWVICEEPPRFHLSQLSYHAASKALLCGFLFNHFSSGSWELYLNKQFGYSKTSFQINPFIFLGHKALCNFKFCVLVYQEEEEIEVLCCGLFVKCTLKTLELNFSLNTEICFWKQIFSILSINFNAKYFYNYLNVLSWIFLATTKFFLVSERNSL